MPMNRICDVVFWIRLTVSAASVARLVWSQLRTFG